MFAPVEAPHAGQILCAGQLGAVALELDARARGAQQVVQTPCQQAPLRGLDEEVAGTCLVGARDGSVVFQAGEHEHRHVLEAGRAAQLPTGVETVKARHHGVEHDDVGRPVAQQFQRLFTASGLDEVETAFAQGQRRQQQVDLIVVNQQDLGLAGVAGVGVGVR